MSRSFSRMQKKKGKKELGYQDEGVEEEAKEEAEGNKILI